MAQRKHPTIRDLLLPIFPKVIAFLMELTKARSGAKFAQSLSHEGTALDANSLYRYNKKRVMPMFKLPELCIRAGFSAEQTGWLLGHFLMEEYGHHPVVFGALPSEIREPAPRYDEGGLESRLKVVDGFDFGGLRAEETFAFNRERNALQAACRELQAEVEEAEDRLEGKTRALVDLLDIFIERAEKALRRPRGDF